MAISHSCNIVALSVDRKLFIEKLPFVTVSLDSKFGEHDTKKSWAAQVLPYIGTALSRITLIGRNFRLKDTITGSV